MSKLSSQADRSYHARALFTAEDKAKKAKKNLWKDYVEAPLEENVAKKDEEGHSNESASEESSRSQTCAYQKVITMLVYVCVYVHVLNCQTYTFL